MGGTDFTCYLEGTGQKVLAGRTEEGSRGSKHSSKVFCVRGRRGDMNSGEAFCVVFVFVFLNYGAY